MAKKKYFMAVVLRGRAFTDAETIKEELHARFGLKGALRSPAHITLHRPFEWRADREGQLLAKMEEFGYRCSFETQLEGFARFSERVIYIGVAPDAELLRLHKELARFAQQELGLLNEVNDERGFHPHVTVAFRDLRRNRFPVVWQWIQSKNYSHAIHIHGFSLLRLEDKWREIRFFDLMPNI